MKTSMQLVIVVALAAAVAGIIAIKMNKAPGTATAAIPAPLAPAADTTNTAPMAVAKLPKLVDLGAGKCIPCKLMTPILEDLKQNFADRLEVQFIDVWEHPEAAKPYAINLIPTQIFFDVTGKELFRHEGFFAKEDILTKWKELGVNLEPKPAQTP